MSPLSKSLIALLGIAFVACSQTDSQTNSLTLSVSTDTPSIVGGKLADENSVGVRSVARLNLADGECTATLINKRLLLTAAHCVIDETASFTTTFGNDESAIVRVTNWKVHQDFKQRADVRVKNKIYPNNINDIAVLLLEEPAPEFAKVAMLDMRAYPVASKIETTIFGYGLTGYLSALGEDSSELRVVTTTGEVNELFPDKIHFNQREEKGFCTGDSGGPLFTISDKNYSLTAIVTNNSGAYRMKDGRLRPADRNVRDFCKYESLATLVTPYRSWINEAARELLNR